MEIEKIQGSRVEKKSKSKTEIIDLMKYQKNGVINYIVILKWVVLCDEILGDLFT